MKKYILIIFKQCLKEPLTELYFSILLLLQCKANYAFTLSKYNDSNVLKAKEKVKCSIQNFTFMLIFNSEF